MSGISTTILDRKHLEPCNRLSSNEVLGHYFHFTDTIEQAGSEVIFQTVDFNQRLSPPHYHSHMTEGILVLSGKVIIWTTSEERVVHPLSYTVFPPGEHHSHMIFNPFMDTAEVILIREQNREDKITFLPEDPWENIDCARY